MDAPILEGIETQFTSEAYESAIQAREEVNWLIRANIAQIMRNLYIHDVAPLDSLITKQIRALRFSLFMSRLTLLQDNVDLVGFWSNEINFRAMYEFVNEGCDIQVDYPDMFKTFNNKVIHRLELFTLAAMASPQSLFKRLIYNYFGLDRNFSFLMTETRDLDNTTES